MKRKPWWALRVIQEMANGALYGLATIIVLALIGVFDSRDEMMTATGIAITAVALIVAGAIAWTILRWQQTRKESHKMDKFNIADWSQMPPLAFETICRLLYPKALAAIWVDLSRAERDDPNNATMVFVAKNTVRAVLQEFNDGPDRREFEQETLRLYDEQAAREVAA